ncbi:hypothetical protein GCM10011512_04320 [Tersicoccus solisilvae]|uniref:Potassium transporter Trk n=1 Tax=Tersicoccus solisilvae TaxID=1882339 RepID=A0ABQ1NRE2_9MICC|nr:hypothetical protein GCM10011512_04320 [Tersicoccus solisilvae]
MPSPDADPAPEAAGPAGGPGRPGDLPVVETVERREVLVRRAPRFAPFLVGGAVLGFVVAGLFTLGRPEDPQYTPAAAFGFFAMLFGIAGVGLGALLALLLDRRSHRRARRASADEVTGTVR